MTDLPKYWALSLWKKTYGDPFPYAHYIQDDLNVCYPETIDAAVALSRLQAQGYAQMKQVFRELRPAVYYLEDPCYPELMFNHFISGHLLNAYGEDGNNFATDISIHDLQLLEESFLWHDESRYDSDNNAHDCLIKTLFNMAMASAQRGAAFIGKWPELDHDIVEEFSNNVRARIAKGKISIQDPSDMLTARLTMLEDISSGKKIGLHCQTLDEEYKDVVILKLCKAIWLGSKLEKHGDRAICLARIEDIADRCSIKKEDIFIDTNTHMDLSAEIDHSRQSTYQTELIANLAPNERIAPYHDSEKSSSKPSYAYSIERSSKRRGRDARVISPTLKRQCPIYYYNKTVFPEYDTVDQGYFDLLAANKMMATTNLAYDNEANITGWQAALERPDNTPNTLLSPASIRYRVGIPDLEDNPTYQAVCAMNAGYLQRL